MPESNFSPDKHDNLSKAFLVGIQMPDATPEMAQELLDELAELVSTLGLEVTGCTVARMREPNPAYGIGSGKAKEITELAEQSGADVIIIDDPLSPAQQRNWEKLSDLAVIDRQEVILDIFASRAHTSEAVLQVNLAKANYALPRLKRRWTHLSRQRGAAGGLGGRAEGEQQLELDSRVIRRKIAQYIEELAVVRKQRDTQRQKRLKKPVPVVAIVGYTNAGKSSLLNALTSAGILAEDKLFATLDPTVRRFKLPGGQDILLADTVGFIRKLPHQLVEAFKATLEETRLSDYIIEVLDASAACLNEHHDTTQKVLAEIGCEDKDTLVVLNKIDLITDELQRTALLECFPNAVAISARTGEGLKELMLAVEEMATRSQTTERLLLPHTRYDALSVIRTYCTILHESYEEDGIHLEIKAAPKVADLIRQFRVEK